MARTSTQIEIPVSLKASLEGLKEVQTQVSQALDKAGKNTTLGKTLAKELSTTAAKFGEIDEILFQRRLAFLLRAYILRLAFVLCAQKSFPYTVLLFLIYYNITKQK